MPLTMTLGVPRPSLRSLLCGLAAGLMLLGVLAVAAPSRASAAPTPMTALLLGSTVESGTAVGGGSESLEQQQAEADGYTVTVVSDSTWQSWTEAQFASYQLIIIGDHGTGCADTVDTGSVADSNAATWEPAVMDSGGNKVLIGADPTRHYELGSAPYAPQLEKNGLAYAGAVSSATGVYMDLGCTYDNATPGTAVPILDGLSTQGPRQFTVVGENSNTLPKAACDTGVNIVASTGPTSGLSDADLSNWDCSVHEAFTSYPLDYTPLALAPTSSGFPSEYCANDVETDTQACGSPYILVSGGGVSVSSDISLSPASQDAATSFESPGHATVTATLDGGSAESGQPITFTIASGPDSGQTQTIDADSNGQATFTIDNSGAPGTDSVSASFTDASGNVERALASVNFQGASQVSASAQDLTGTEQTALGDPAVATFTDPSNSIPGSGWNATVSWGDGSSSSSGTVSPTGASGPYSVNANHTYTAPGVYTVTVTITDASNSADTTTVTSTATISKGQLAVNAQAINPSQGVSFTGQVATFTNTDLSTTASSYAATINWGDGTSSSAGTATAVSGTPGSFTVSGSHTYSTSGTYTMTVTVTGGDNPDTTASGQSTVTVTSTLLTVTGRGTLTLPTETLTGTLATIRYGTTSAPASGFKAAINWGDGATGTGTITGSDGSYTVTGSHTFAGAGPYPVTVTVTDPAHGTGSATTTVIVPSTVAALSLPATISAKRLLCGIKRHRKCTGETILGTFRGSGNAAWNVSISKSGKGSVALGRLTRSVSAGRTSLVFKVTNRSQSKRLYKLIKKHRLNQLTVQQVFTNAVGASSRTTLFTRVTR